MIMNILKWILSISVTDQVTRIDVNLKPVEITRTYMLTILGLKVGIQAIYELVKE